MAGGLVVGLGVWKGGPWVRDYFSHVSTDDAFIAGYATTVASRLSDLVEQVLVHDNDYVERGAVLVRLDRRPFEIAVDQMRSDLRQAKLNVDRMVKSLEAPGWARPGARPGPVLGRRARGGMAGRRGAAGAGAPPGSPACGPRPPRSASYAELILRQKDHERVKNLVVLADGHPRGARPEAGGAPERSREIQGRRAVRPAGPGPARWPRTISIPSRSPRTSTAPTPRSAAPWPRGSRSWRTWVSPPACAHGARGPPRRPAPTHEQHVRVLVRRRTGGPIGPDAG